MLSRAEIEQNDKWRIEDIYASDALWEEDYKRFLRECEMPCQYKGSICECADNLALVLDEQDKADFLAVNVWQGTDGSHKIGRKIFLCRA